MGKKGEDKKRVNKVTFLLNDSELEAFDIFCKKYRVDNKSQHVRETVIKDILMRFDKDYPSLFQQLRDSKFKSSPQNTYVQGVLFGADSF